MVEHIGTGVAILWNNTLLPILELLIAVIGNVAEAILGLWNNVLMPLIQWITHSWGPPLANIINSIWDIIQAVFTSIGKVIQGLMQSLTGLTDFLAGVFTGNWTRAWKGLVNIFIGLGNSLIGATETIVNGIISIINHAISLIYSAVTGLINSVLHAVSGIAKVFGKNLNLTIGTKPPRIPTLSIPKIPMLAQGGVISSPTMTMVGEGRYSEAVVPLDNSPQMKELVSEIAKAVNKPDSDNPQPIEVHVYLDGKEITHSQNRANRRFGKTQQNV